MVIPLVSPDSDAVISGQAFFPARRDEPLFPLKKKLLQVDGVGLTLLLVGEVDVL
jgi:hypothetical protein